jgi:hypothetical protein
MSQGAQDCVEQSMRPQNVLEKALDETHEATRGWTLFLMLAIDYTVRETRCKLGPAPIQTDCADGWTAPIWE